MGTRNITYRLSPLRSLTLTCKRSASVEKWTYKRPTHYFDRSNLPWGQYYIMLYSKPYRNRRQRTSWLQTMVEPQTMKIHNIHSNNIQTRYQIHTKDKYQTNSQSHNFTKITITRQFCGTHISVRHMLTECNGYNMILKFYPRTTLALAVEMPRMSNFRAGHTSWFFVMI